MEKIVEAFWGTNIRKAITAFAAMISAIAGAILAVPSAWSAIGLPELATRQWARTEIADPIKAAQVSTTKQVIDLQIDLANGKLDQLDNTRASLEIEKLKSSDAEVKAKADAQIRKIERDSGLIQDQLRTLRSIR